MKLSQKTKRGLELASLPHFLHDFLRKVFLTLSSINLPNFIVWFLLLLDILENMCIVIISFSACDAINFEISLSFLIKLFFYMTKNLRQKVKGATKLYFTHYFYVLIILFNMSLHKSAFSNLSFGILVFRPSVFSVLSVYSVFQFHLDFI